MKLGLDLDGVLAEFTTSYLQYYNDAHGTSYVKEEFEAVHFSSHLGLTHDELKKSIQHFFTTPYAKTILPMKGSQDALKKLATQHELHIITSRPLSVSTLTLEWLNDFFPDLFTSIHFTNDWLLQPELNKLKADICIELAIDIMIEDYYPYAQACAPCVRKQVLLFDNPWNQQPTLTASITRVRSWNEVVSTIEAFSL